MDWKILIRDGDGTPRVIYLDLDGVAKLVLEAGPGVHACLKVKLLSGAIRQEKAFWYQGGPGITDPATKDWAVRTAYAYLDELEGLAGRARRVLKAGSRDPRR